MPGQWHFGEDLGTEAGTGSDRERAADKVQSLAHADEAESARC